MIGAGLSGADLFLLLILVLPAFLLIAYLTILMMDIHAENDDE